MSPWLETVGVLLISAGGVAAGWWFSRQPKNWWMLGYFLPLLLILALGAARWDEELVFATPFSWLMAGRREYVAGALAAAMILATLIPKVPQARTRRLVSLFLAVIVLLPAIEVFALHGFIRGKMAALTTQLDNNGVCRQGTDYNCGPAAATTVLRKLGIHGEEGALALAARTGPIHGTPPDMLADAVNQLYGAQGVRAEYRLFKDIPSLQTNTPLVAVIKFGFLVDHYVAVLEVSQEEVLIGDPLSGLRRLSHAEFKEIWRRSVLLFHQ